MRTDSYALITILCAVDFSEYSRDTLRYAVTLARRFEARLLVLNVADPLLVTAAGTRALDVIAGIQKDLRKFVDVTLAGAASPPVVEILVETGTAAQEILAVAHREHAELVTIGTYGMSGVRTLLVGSTAQHVIRHADIPVLAVPQSKSRREGASNSRHSSAESRSRGPRRLKEHSRR